jgi:hypothetical protein
MACQTSVRDILEVEIPVEARLEGEQILTEGETLMFGIPEEIEKPHTKKQEYPFIVPDQEDALKTAYTTLEDNLSDLERIYREIQRKAGISDPG